MEFTLVQVITWKKSTLFFLLVAFIVARPAFAALVPVDVLNNSFSPSTLQINVDDTVIWTNQDDDDDAHSATSDNGAWSGGLMVGFGEQFSFTFTSAGTNFYHDIFDGFTGKIIVVDPTPPPAAISLSAFKMLNGQFQFDISGLTVGKTNYVLASTNLTSWIPLRTNVATNSISSFTQTQALSFSRRFYRVQELP